MWSTSKQKRRVFCAGFVLEEEIRSFRSDADTAFFKDFAPNQGENRCLHTAIILLRERILTITSHALIEIRNLNAILKAANQVSLHARDCRLIQKISILASQTNGFIYLFKQETVKDFRRMCLCKNLEGREEKNQKKLRKKH